MSKKRCVIFGAAPIDTAKCSYEKTYGDYIIAADGGLDTLKKLGITPDLVIGDFDSSLLEPPEDALVYPSVKDDTDTEIAAKTGLERGFRDFIIYGATGGARVDHTYAAIQTCALLAKEGAEAKLRGDGFTVHFLKDRSLSFPARESGYLSIFSYGGTGEVKIEGLKYEGRVTLDPYYTLGASNEFIGKNATVTAISGIIMIFEYDSPGG